MEVTSLAEEEGSRFPTVFWGSKNFVSEANNQEVAEIADANGLVSSLVFLQRVSLYPSCRPNTA